MDNLTKKLIGTRINTALATANLKQKELAKELNVTDNTVSYWCNSSRIPNTEQIIHIAKFLNVSTDYLLGFTKNPTTDKDDSFITDCLGLDEKSIKLLKSINGSDFSNAVNFILSHNRIYPLLRNIKECKDELTEAVKKQMPYIQMPPEEREKTYIDFESIENCYRDSRFAFFETVEIFKEIINDYKKDLEETYRQNDTNLTI